MASRISSAIGSAPIVDETDVMRIGRNRSRAAPSAASTSAMQSAIHLEWFHDHVRIERLDPVTNADEILALGGKWASGNDSS